MSPVPVLTLTSNIASLSGAPSMGTGYMTACSLIHFLPDVSLIFDHMHAVSCLPTFGPAAVYKPLKDHTGIKHS